MSEKPLVESEDDFADEDEFFCPALRSLFPSDFPVIEDSDDSLEAIAELSGIRQAHLFGVSCYE